MLLLFISVLTLAKAMCNANSCSHICAVVDGQDQCFCPLGFELLGDNSTCDGKQCIDKQFKYPNNQFVIRSL